MLKDSEHRAKAVDFGGRLYVGGRFEADHGELAEDFGESRLTTPSDRGDLDIDGS